MLVDSGSTSNYISAQCQAGLDLEVQLERDFECLTLADGSEVHPQGYVRFVLHCGDYNCKIFACVFPNLQQELILGIPWLIKANPKSIGLLDKLKWRGMEWFTPYHVTAGVRIIPAEQRKRANQRERSISLVPRHSNKYYKEIQEENGLICDSFRRWMT